MEIYQSFNRRTKNLLGEFLLDLARRIRSSTHKNESNDIGLFFEIKERKSKLFNTNFFLSLIDFMSNKIS